MLGTLVKNHLDENGVKYSFVANEVGIPINVFSSILNEKRKITAEEYFTICSALKVDTSYFANIMQNYTTIERGGLTANQ